MNLYCIRDLLAKESGPLFEAKNDGVACRMYSGVNLPGDSNDFELLFIGSYDHDKSVIKPVNPPVRVVSSTNVED